MTLFLFFILIFVAVFLVYSIHSGFKYTRMIANIFLSLVYKPSLESFSSGRGEKISILSSSDTQLEALFCQAQDPRGIVIFCHESGSSKESWEKYAFFLPEQGFHVLSIDYQEKSDPGVKNSLHQWPITEDVDRLSVAIRWAKKAVKDNQPVILFGVSMGADVALAASSRESAVKAVIADGLFSMKEIFRDYIRKWAPVLVRPNLFGEHYPGWVVAIFTNLGFWYSQKKSKKIFVDVEKILCQSHPPLLMIYGEKDDYIPVTHQQFLEKKNHFSESTRRLVVPEAGHNQAIVLGREAYEKTILDFLRKSL